MAIIKNPQIILKSDMADTIVDAMVDDINDGTYIGMESSGQMLTFTGTSSQQLSTILSGLDLSQVQIQYRYNANSTPVQATGTLTLYTDGTLTFADGTVFHPLFQFVPTTPADYADGLNAYIVNNVCEITISDT